MPDSLDHLKEAFQAADCSSLTAWVELGGELGWRSKPLIWDWDYLKGWQPPSARGHEFSVIGHFPNGDLLALWRYPGLEGPRPVVFLGHEWSFTVLAADSLGFLELIASGAFASEDEPEPEPEPEPTSLFGKFVRQVRNYAIALTGVVPREAAEQLVQKALEDAGRAEPRSREAVTEEALAAHPDLMQAFDAWDEELQPFIDAAIAWRTEHRETKGDWPSQKEEDAFFADFFGTSPMA